MLFSSNPRRLIPGARARATATALRRYSIGMGPLFPVPAHAASIGLGGLLGCLLVGVLAGALAAVVTYMVYASEDAFGKLPIHWMWWPPIGGLVIGLGVLIFPQALGVGYDTIAAMLQGDVTTKVMVGILLVKSVIWSVSLGSGTSGGVLAPLLLMGGALGGLEAGFLPHEGVGFWPLISMSATLGGTIGSPLTAVVFSLELTHDVTVLLPLLVAGMMAHAFTVLLLKRSILTEKVARRGYHLSREYAVDPLEILFVREVMRTNVVALPAEISVKDLDQKFRALPHRRGQQLYPVVDRDNQLVGIITRNDVRKLVQTERKDRPDQRLADVVEANPVVAHSDEPLRLVVNRMADTGLTRFPVVEGNSRHKLVGMISIRDLLQARVRSLEEERPRERVLRVRLPFENPERPHEEADRVSASETRDSR
jgi:CBS domain-containing protein